MSTKGISVACVASAFGQVKNMHKLYDFTIKRDLIALRLSIQYSATMEEAQTAIDKAISCGAVEKVDNGCLIRLVFRNKEK